MDLSFPGDKARCHAVVTQEELEPSSVALNVTGFGMAGWQCYPLVMSK